LKVLVTGASGYIGSQTCKCLVKNNHTVTANDLEDITHDYFSTKKICNYKDLKVKDVDCLVHIGATSLVTPSLIDPRQYWENNVSNTVELLKNCNKKTKVIFASSAGVYGEPSNGVCFEDMEFNPCSPYGWSKRMVELILESYYSAYNQSSISLRFFNVAGADTESEMGQKSNASHIIAKAMESAISKKQFTLFGNDYDTPDGTCVRDYVHVEDISQGILDSIAMLQNKVGAYQINLGGKSCYSNYEILEAITSQTGLKINLKISESRQGEPSVLIADTAKAKQLLNWKPCHCLNSIIKTAYLWYQKGNKND